MTRLPILAAICILPTGCFNVYHTANVMVRDESTGQPLSNVTVAIVYHAKVDPFAPITFSAVTDSAGRVTLPVSAYEHGQHFFAIVPAVACEYCEITGSDVKQLPMWWLWSGAVNHSNEPVNFYFDIATKKDMNK